MGLEPYFGGIVSAAIFCIGGWIALKGGYERRFGAIELKLVEHDEKIRHAMQEAEISRDLKAQMAALSQKMDDLADDVRRHNNLVERMVVVERDQQTMWKRQDELRDDLHEMKVGGTG